MRQEQHLANILKNPFELFEARHDAALDLGDFVTAEALDALLQVATTNHPITNIDEQIIIEACGESIARILIAMNKLDKDIFIKLNPYAQADFLAVVKTHRPEWLVNLIE